MTELDKQIFEDAMSANFEELQLLRLKYIAAQLREAELKDMFDQTYDEVLKEHEFYVAEEKRLERYELKVGDRITEHDLVFLMSDFDHKQYLKYAQGKQFERGYIKEDGTYKDGFNGLDIKMRAENELVRFFLSLLPKEFQEAISPAMRNYTHKHKIIDLIMKS